MSNGYTYEEKQTLKTEVDITELLKEWYHDDFLYRNNGTMVSKDLTKRSLVIYPKSQTNPSHGYIHHKPKQPDDWKDNIFVIEKLFNCGFVEACDLLSDYLYGTNKSRNIPHPIQNEPNIPHYGLFD